MNLSKIETVWIKFQSRVIGRNLLKTDQSGWAISQECWTLVMHMQYTALKMYLKKGGSTTQTKVYYDVYINKAEHALQTKSCLKDNISLEHIDSLPKKFEWRRWHERYVAAFISIICLSFTLAIQIFGVYQYALKI